MSIIAYRDGILACDSRMTSGSAILTDSCKKIAKGPNVVGGFVGGAEELGEYLRWVTEGAVFANIPSGEGTGFIVFDRSIKKKKIAQLFIINKNKFLELQLNPWDYYADGSGYKAAFGAFYMGASAEDAVNAAIRHDNDCGGLIHIEELWDEN